MVRKATVEMGIDIPDFVTNKDVYDGLDEAAEKLEEKHVTVTDIAVTDLPPDGSMTQGDDAHVGE